MRKLFAFFILFTLLGCDSDNEPAPQNSITRILIESADGTSNDLDEIILINGTQQQFIATAHFSDGTSKDVTKSVTWENINNKNTGFVDVSQGMVSGIEAGDVLISATMENSESNSIQLTIIDAMLTAINVEIIDAENITNSFVYLDQNPTLRATGTYDNGTTASLANPVIWNISPPDSALINDNRSVSFINNGLTTITATKDGQTSQQLTFNVKDVELMAITVEADNNVNTIQKGHPMRLRVFGSYADGEKTEITTGISWSSKSALGSAGKMDITEDGGFIPTAKGRVLITAQVNNPTPLKHTVDITVTDPILKNIVIKPGTVDLLTEQQTTLHAVGFYTTATDGVDGIDITTNVSWEIVEGNSATLANGIITATDTVGETTFVAKMSNDGRQVTSNTVKINVISAKLNTIEIVNVPVNLFTNQTHKLTAMGTYNDGKPPRDITHIVQWKSSRKARISIKSGLIKSNNTYGSAPITITANIGEVNATINTTVKLGIMTVTSFNGKTFTSSPTQLFAESLHILPDENHIETGRNGPKNISFALYNFDKAKLFCEKLNKNNFLSKTNWQQATKNELSSTLLSQYPNLYASHGWPTQWYYGSRSISGINFYNVLFPGNVVYPDGAMTIALYRSCVSAP